MRFRSRDFPRYGKISLTRFLWIQGLSESLTARQLHDVFSASAGVAATAISAATSAAVIAAESTAAAQQDDDPQTTVVIAAAATAIVTATATAEDSIAVATAAA